MIAWTQTRILARLQNPRVRFWLLVSLFLSQVGTFGIDWQKSGDPSFVGLCFWWVLTFLIGVSSSRKTCLVDTFIAIAYIPLMIFLALSSVIMLKAALVARGLHPLASLGEIAAGAGHFLGTVMIASILPLSCIYPALIAGFIGGWAINRLWKMRAQEIQN
jgi:hypothetical protein